jgi:hypothetical protein
MTRCSTSVVIPASSAHTSPTYVRTVGDVGEDIHVYLLMGQRQSWDQMWPQLRTLTVS